MHKRNIVRVFRAQEVQNRAKPQDFMTERCSKYRFRQSLVVYKVIFTKSWRCLQKDCINESIATKLCAQTPFLQDLMVNRV